MTVEILDPPRVLHISDIYQCQHYHQRVTVGGLMRKPMIAQELVPHTGSVVYLIGLFRAALVSGLVPKFRSIQS